MSEFWTAYLQNILLVFIGVAAGIPLGKRMGYDEGYKLGHFIGRVEGVTDDFKCPKMEMHEDGDAE